MENEFIKIIKDAYGMQAGNYIIRIFQGEKVPTGTEILSHLDNNVIFKINPSIDGYSVKFEDSDHWINYSPKVLQHYIDNWNSIGDSSNPNRVFTWQIIQLPF